MAIRDLLWACPLCGLEGGLRRTGRWEACRGCGARFRRGRGASIIARAADGTTRIHAAAEWADRLPGIEEYTSRLEPDKADGVLRQSRVRARVAVGESVIRLGSTYLNRIERFGPPRDGVLALYGDRLRFAPDAGEAEEWTFDEITAVQPSSSTLQVKARRRPVVSFRFPEESARFWEELLCAAIRRHYRANGRGEIIEFQPRIVTR
ncbi:MAG: hypothetical protein FWJ74_09215 [Gemmatimonadota bacterium]|jgi:hypothetical protein